MSASGCNRDRLHNIEIMPVAEIAVPNNRFAAVYRLLGVDEASRVLAGYERRNRVDDFDHSLFSQQAARLAVPRWRKRSAKAGCAIAAYCF